MAGVPPVKGEAFTLYTMVVSQADTDIFQVNPTIAAGDFQRSIDDGAFANLTTLPTIDPAGSAQIKLQLSATEMNGDVITVWGNDAAGAEWCDVFIQIFTGTTVWGGDDADTRTLTTATSPVTTLTGSNINIVRGDTLDLDIAGLGDISGRDNLFFTVKVSLEDDDTESIIQIDEDNGLLYLEGAAAAVAANGSITVTDAAAGDITIVLAAAESDDLTPRGGLYYDIQMISGTTVQTLSMAGARISGDVTRVIT